MGVTKIKGIADSLIPVGISNLGTIVFDNVYFPFGQWTDLEGIVHHFNGAKMDAVALVVNRSKIIIKSNVSGRVGSIKEYITSNDYEIMLSAVIAPDTFSAAQLALAGIGNQSVAAAASVLGTTPTEPIGPLFDLAQLEQVQDRVKIRCKFLQNIYNINFVVIESMNIEKTGPDTYVVKMLMVSDFGVDLKDYG